MKLTFSEIQEAMRKGATQVRLSLLPIGACVAHKDICCIVLEQLGETTHLLKSTGAEVVYDGSALLFLRTETDFIKEENEFNKLVAGEPFTF